MGLPRWTGTSPFDAARDGDRPWQNAVRGGLPLPRSPQRGGGRLAFLSDLARIFGFSPGARTARLKRCVQPTFRWRERAPRVSRWSDLTLTGRRGELVIERAWARVSWRGSFGKVRGQGTGGHHPAVPPSFLQRRRT